MSVSSERIQLSKRQRFDIFNRDGFVCKYCGKSPPAVKLVVDHVLPVKMGGTNDPDNLVTSCAECNQGKAALPLGRPGLSQDAAKAQERLEDIDDANLANKAARARVKMREAVMSYYCDLTGSNEIKRATLSSLVNMARNHGSGMLFQWMDTAHSRLRYFSEIEFIRYVCGCARNHTAEKGAAG